MECLPKKVSRGRREKGALESQEGTSKANQDASGNRNLAIVAGAQFGGSKSLADSFKDFCVSDSAHRSTENLKARIRSANEAPLRSTSSWAGSASSRTSSAFSECVAYEGPIQPSAASLESPSRRRLPREVSSPEAEGQSLVADLVVASSQHATTQWETGQEVNTSNSTTGTAPAPRHQFRVLEEKDGVNEGAGHDPGLPSLPEPAISEKPSSGDESDDPGSPEAEYCTGIKWFVRNSKLVVAGFSSWSLADKLGVKHGDILRCVDGVDVLSLALDEDGQHPAMELLEGPYGSQCELSLMRVDPDQVRAMMQRAQDGQPSFSKEKLELKPITFSVPRLIRSDIGSPL